MDRVVYPIIQRSSQAPRPQHIFGLDFVLSCAWGGMAWRAGWVLGTGCVHGQKSWQWQVAAPESTEEGKEDGEVLLATSNCGQQSGDLVETLSRPCRDLVETSSRPRRDLVETLSRPETCSTLSPRPDFCRHERSPDGGDESTGGGDKRRNCSRPCRDLVETGLSLVYVRSNKGVHSWMSPAIPTRRRAPTYPGTLCST